MNSILVIGQAPAKSSVTRIPWNGGNSSKRLWKWFRVNSQEELAELVDTIHAIPYYMGRNGKGDIVPVKKETIFGLRDYVIKRIIQGKYEKVIMVGKFSQNLIGKYLRYLPWKIEKLSIPHPSGINISINGKDVEIKRKVTEFLKEN